MKTLTIGKVARSVEVGVETIRFYERQGLIPEPPRRDSGYRDYPEETVQRLGFIKRAKELGFTLKEIKELLDLRIEDADLTACDDVRSLAENKISGVRSKIETLRRIEVVLAQLVSDCCNRAVTDTCPILKALQQEEM